ncbi:hypothetical protein [Haloarchaeobius iranensis]|uniref:Nudix hydrolase domain-containing protein n=1 Tax=Haloarchaeobius iranensis TaxID=996166 RepID=A0A1G9UNT9_9EURY|nr:hypothetical protein [Haloarchaeobius iranensis]SDM61608.1 hypothetical protein SAMN05192554_104239 [Haloarchaeobius iranensis]
MHDTTHDTTVVPNDPTELAARDDVEEVTQQFVHEDHDYCEEEYAGRAIVGVTTDAGDLLLIVAGGGENAVLPSPKVEHDDDWAEAARAEVSEVAGIDVRITGVERLRHAEQVLGGGGDPADVTTHLVLAAEPVAADPELAPPEDGSWTVEWVDSYPHHMLDEDSPSGDDVGLFLD